MSQPPTQRSLRSGSVLVYILILTIAMGSVVLSLVALSGSHYRNVVHDEQAMRAQYAFEGASNKTRYNAANSIVAVPSTTAYTIGSWSVSTTIADNSATLANTITVSESASRWGRSYTNSLIMGNDAGPDKTWWNYVVGMNTSSAFPNYVISHGATDSFFSNNTFTVGAASTVRKDLDIVAASQPSSVTVNGVFHGGSTAKVWLTPKASDYAAAADYTLSGTQTYTSGATFPSPNFLVYVTGDVHIGGTFNGTCTVYATGNIYIDATLSYGNASTDKFVFITPGTVYLNTANGHFVGYFYAGTTIAINQKMTLDSGALITDHFTGAASKSLDVTWDDDLSVSSTLGANLHVPGFWP